MEVKKGEGDCVERRERKLHELKVGLIGLLMLSVEEGGVGLLWLGMGWIWDGYIVGARG